MNRDLPMFASEHSESEPDQFVAIERAHKDASCRLQSNRQRHGQAVFISYFPDFSFDPLKLAQVVQAHQIPNNDPWRNGGRDHFRPFSRTPAAGSNHRPAASSSCSISRSHFSARRDSKCAQATCNAFKTATGATYDPL